MVAIKKQLSNSFSTGGGGVNFETRVQSAFVVLMLCGGVAPAMPPWPITKIKLQGKHAGFETDDFIAYVNAPSGGAEYKLLAQIKHSLVFTEKDATFRDVIAAAWNDFNNPNVFQRQRDQIALITGPLSATDIAATRQLLERARHSENSKSFFENTTLAKFVGDVQRKKLCAFQAQLNAAKGSAVTPDECWEFLKSFHLLGYDLDIQAGVTLSLLHSMVGQFAGDQAKYAWLSVLDAVQVSNQNAGTISRETLSPEIVGLFEPKVVYQQPAMLKTSGPVETVPSTLVMPPMFVSHHEVYVVAALLGEWIESNEADCRLIATISGNAFAAWLKSAREVLLQSGSKLKCKSGHWSVVDRSIVLSDIAPHIFNEHLDRFRIAAVDVLSEVDPKFDLNADQRILADMRGKTLTYSHNVRNGIAEGLAMLGNLSTPLSSCDHDKVDNTVSSSVHEVLADASGLVWASLNDLLPHLAEASPNAFLSAVEAGLTAKPCRFVEVFDVEESGFTGVTYMSGLLWALETLAWNAAHFSRVVICLGDLAVHDRGGSWSNRPANSLITILLPWLPQTTASLAHQATAVRALALEIPVVGWTLVLGLLPNSHSTSTGSRKPIWLKVIPDEWNENITYQDYWSQVTVYAGLAIDLAGVDQAKLSKLVEHLADLPPVSQQQLLAHLGSTKVLEVPETDRFRTWEALIDVIARHKRFSDAAWVMPAERIASASKVANLIAPRTPTLLYQRLFTNNDFELFENDEGDYEVQQAELHNRRIEAIKLILCDGVKSVIEFARVVESPLKVGAALGFGESCDERVDNVLLPNLLDFEGTLRDSFLFGFVSGRFQFNGWTWVESLNIAAWSREQIGQFLSYLPFNAEVWAFASKALGKDVSHYWSRTFADAYQASGELNIAVDELLRFGRPYAAIRCLGIMRHNKVVIDSDKVVKALLDAPRSNEPLNAIDNHQIVVLIKFLQVDAGVKRQDVAAVEWAYLNLVEHGRNIAPKALEQRLSNEPDFFLNVIRLVFRSKNNGQTSKPEPTENEKAIASNAYRLLNRWKTPPGFGGEGAFDGAKLDNWLKDVKQKSQESGHFDIAMSVVGQVMINAPADPNGLWIHQAAAAALNGRDVEPMRDGFRTELFNSRGVFSPTGGVGEIALATEYKERAEQVDLAGFTRLATTLRDIADSYERYAKRESNNGEGSI